MEYSKELVEKRFAELLQISEKQAAQFFLDLCASGDVVKYVDIREGNEKITYEPFRVRKELEDKLKTAVDALKVFADENSYHHDKFGIELMDVKEFGNRPPAEYANEALEKIKGNKK